MKVKVKGTIKSRQNVYTPGIYQDPIPPVIINELNAGSNLVEEIPDVVSSPAVTVTEHTPSPEPVEEKAAEPEPADKEVEKAVEQTEKPKPKKIPKAKKSKKSQPSKTETSEQKPRVKLNKGK